MLYDSDSENLGESSSHNDNLILISYFNQVCQEKNVIFEIDHSKTIYYDYIDKYELFELLCKKGYEKLIDWFYETYIKDQEKKVFLENGVAILFLNGFVDIGYKYLKSGENELIKIIFFKLCNYGNVELVSNFLQRIEIPFNIICNGFLYSLNNFDFILFIHNILSHSIEETINFYEKLLIRAIYNNKIEIVKWIISIKNISLKTKEEAFRLSCEKNLLEFAKLFVEDVDKFTFNWNDLFISCCMCSLDIIIFISNLHHNYVEINQGLINAIISNNFELFKFLVYCGLDIHFDKNRAIIESCSVGNIEIVSLLIQYEFNADYNLDFRNNLYHKWNLGFTECCRRGHLDIVKLLFDLGIKNDDGFKESCLYGHLEIANWLLEQGYTIDDDLFIKACTCSKKEVIVWIESKRNISDELYDVAFRALYNIEKRHYHRFKETLIYFLVDREYFRKIIEGKKFGLRKSKIIYFIKIIYKKFGLRKVLFILGFLYGGESSKFVNKIGFDIFANCLNYL